MSAGTAVTNLVLVAGAIGIDGGISLIWRARISPPKNVSEVVQNAPYHLLE